MPTPTVGPVTAFGSGAITADIVLTGVGAGDFIVVGYDIFEAGGAGDNTIASVAISGESNATPITALNEANVSPLGPTIKQFFVLASVVNAGTKTITATFTGTASYPSVNIIAAAYPSGSTVDDCQYEAAASSSAIPGCTLATTAAGDAILSLLTVSASTTAGSGFEGFVHTHDLNYYGYAEYTADAGAASGAKDVRYASIGTGSWHAGAVAIKSSGGTLTATRGTGTAR